MNVVVIGTGYVGLTTGASLAFLGHTVTCVDKDHEKVRLISAGKSPIYEPSLEEMMAEAGANLTVVTEAGGAVAGADVIVIAVGTPQTETGDADLQYVLAAARECAGGLVDGREYVVVMKSTVPVGTSRRVIAELDRALAQKGIRPRVNYASNPEFLREGFAIADTFYPDRIVVGSDSQLALDRLEELYRPILDQTFAAPGFCRRPDHRPLPAYVRTDPTSAEMIKYAANAFLAVKISFINEMAGLCERLGADVTEVARGMGYDTRIGHRFLGAGVGWGGSCFPKDTAALIAVGREFEYQLPIVEAARTVNERQRRAVIAKLQQRLVGLRGRTIGVLGLAFKPDTDDVRESPAIDLVRMMAGLGARVIAHDPIAMDNTKRLLTGVEGVEFVDDPHGVAVDAEAILLVTEWRQYSSCNWELMARSMRRPLIVDGRNALKPEVLRAAGFEYCGIGR